MIGTLLILCEWWRDEAEDNDDGHGDDNHAENNAEEGDENEDDGDNE